MVNSPKHQAQVARSQTLDDLIMGTNSSSIVSKRSVERLYYPDEPHFFRHFVSKFQRRSPLINRGYWLRLRAIDVVVRNFITRPSNNRKIVINLGCGSDVLPWQSYARLGPQCDGTLFIDIDYPDLILKKRKVVLETTQLRALLNDNFITNETDQSRVVLRSERYCQVACDLRQLHELHQALSSLLPSTGYEILFVAEVSITYMDTISADNLVQWASSIGRAEFCLLEHIIPLGSNHPFAITMLNHLNKLNAPPKSVHQYPTIESQKERFETRDWAHARALDLWDVWSSDQFLSSAERSLLDEVEPFDEWEEFILFARHYVLVHASTVSDQDAQDQKLPVPETESREVQLEITCHQADAPRRRFGEAMLTTNSTGAQYVENLMGMGSNCRTDTLDIYSIREHSGTQRTPVDGPLPRMCFTLTDLGEYGVLLAGGRGSPANPMSDCWLYRRGADYCWMPTWSLPMPLFRHSAIRLKDTRLTLVVGGKTANSLISEECFLFDPEKGWYRCKVGACKPRPTFGTLLCNSPHSNALEGTFYGLLAGGIAQDGCFISEEYLWCLRRTESEAIIEFKLLPTSHASGSGRPLSLFGAKCMDLDTCTAICGGVGLDPAIQGRDIVFVTIENNGSYAVAPGRCQDGAVNLPFMIGSSVVTHGSHLVIIGGGATCFSMGTFWETGVYSIKLSSKRQAEQRQFKDSGAASIKFAESRKIVGRVSRDTHQLRRQSERAAIAIIPRIRLDAKTSFDKVLADGKPVVIEGLDFGECMQKWKNDYLMNQIGRDTEVVVHECLKDTEKLDFNSKNFSYVKDTFGSVMGRMEAGGRLYLRSLSRDKPSEQPANLEQDFPGLASSFRLPLELARVGENTFSSIFRMSGRVNMWLHYDVMANIYVQITGHKRMILFPPSDVGELAFAPGASSSSLDVFMALDEPRMAGTHPHEAVLGPGDALFLPALWLHTSTPTSDMSVAVNVFFRDLESGYAAGRDVYGNRDLAAYEKGRLEAMRMARSFQQFPLETRRFYLTRLADELRQAAEGL